MIDQHGRNIEYLRLSVTERCDLNCVYCREKGVCNSVKGSARELTPDEVRAAMREMAALGVKKVRLTGGEPLLRSDIAGLIAAVNGENGLYDLCMTTNAQRLSQYAKPLKAAGLMRVNISLDSLKPEKYRELTRGGDINNVLHGIDAAVSAGLSPIKLNVVTVKGQNDCEIDDFIEFTRDNPVDVRFIELMPIGRFGQDESHRVYNSDILRAHPELEPVKKRCKSQPSEDYRIAGYLGRVGFISPLSHRFCEDCNRVRLTSDLKLIPCLGSELEIDLRPVINDAAALRSLIESGIFNKPGGHHFNERGKDGRGMDRIGG